MRAILAVVGIGPRGLSVLEAVLDSLKYDQVTAVGKLLLFESSDHPGSGPVWAPNQGDYNWINVPERTLAIAGRTQCCLAGISLPEFPSYFEWANIPSSNSWDYNLVDVFPPRSKIGHYLRERFDSLFDSLQQSGICQLVKGQVIRVCPDSGFVKIETKNGQSYEAEEVLLTVGHQPTELDEQIQEWQKKSSRYKRTLMVEKPYPIRSYLRRISSAKRMNVAIRGFGLAMMDITRAISCEFGRFHVRNTTTLSTRYELSSGKHLRVAPFSLDGLCMSPKPLNALLDSQYCLSEEEKVTLERQLSNPKAQMKATGGKFLIDAILPIVARVYKEAVKNPLVRITDISEVIESWFNDQKFEHPAVVSQEQEPKIIIESYLSAALGLKPIPLDYCIGQVWRHSQPIIYKSLSYSVLPSTVIAKVIELDERMKRFAFGPPVASMQQLLALEEADVLSLDYLANPDITFTKEGWILSQDASTFKAEVMIDSVLPNTVAQKVSSPLIKSLLTDETVQPVHDELGILTDSYGAVMQSTSALPSSSVWFLGRLAKGTVIGVDDILECFGERSQRCGERIAREIQGHNNSNLCY